MSVSTISVLLRKLDFHHSGKYAEANPHQRQALGWTLPISENPHLIEKFGNILIVEHDELKHGFE